MLTDERPSIDGDYLVSREGEPDLPLSLLVALWLAVRGHQHGAVQDEEVGISGRKPISFFVEDWFCHGERNEPIWLILKRAERLQLCLHLLQLIVVRVAGVCALQISNGVVGAETCQRIDVAVSIVAFEIAMREPQDALSAESLT